jgi:hypothetical protein
MSGACHASVLVNQVYLLTTRINAWTRAALTCGRQAARQTWPAIPEGLVEIYHMHPHAERAHDFGELWQFPGMFVIRYIAERFRD